MSRTFVIVVNDDGTMERGWHQGKPLDTLARQAARIAELEAALGGLSAYWFDRKSNPARVRCRGCDMSAFQHDPAGCPVQRAYAIAPGMEGEA
jgi:hypothetical protein